MNNQNRQHYDLVPMARRQADINSSGVSVIYVTVDEQPPEARWSEGRQGLLGVAAACVHRMADRVEALRRSLERLSG